MITAKDVSMLLKRKLIPEKELDNWINLVLLPSSFSGNLAIVYESNVPFTKNEFIASMLLRGFVVEYVCEYRPCGATYFEITIPPQGE
jgi:hypothetical protein